MSDWFVDKSKLVKITHTPWRVPKEAYACCTHGNSTNTQLYAQNAHLKLKCTYISKNKFCVGKIYILYIYIYIDIHLSQARTEGVCKWE